MENYYENKLSYDGITFFLSNNPVITEREIHSYHEILLYIDGDVKLLSKEGHRSLKNHSIIIIPKETYHHFKGNGSGCFTRLKISFTSLNEKYATFSHLVSELKIYEDLNENMFYAFERLLYALKQKNDNADFYAYSAFLMLLSEIDIAGLDDKIAYPTGNNSLMIKVMEYVSANLSKDLSIKALSEIFHISPSGITHLFKKEYGISLHKFITQRRLIYAQKLVKEGRALSEIISEIGFADYSSFYKAYVEYFGHSPSKDKNAHL